MKKGKHKVHIVWTVSIFQYIHISFTININEAKLYLSKPGESDPIPSYGSSMDYKGAGCKKCI